MKAFEAKKSIIKGDFFSSQVLKNKYHISCYFYFFLKKENVIVDRNRNITEPIRNQTNNPVNLFYLIMAKLVSMLSSFILTVIMNNNISNSSVSGQRNLSQRDLPDTNYRAICITRCAIPRDAKWQSPALRGDKSSIATLMPTAQDSKKSSGLILLLNCTEIWFCHSNKHNFRTHVFESNKAIFLKCLKDIYIITLKIYSGIVQYGCF